MPNGAITDATSLTAAATRLDIDLVNVALIEDVDALLPEERRLSNISRQFTHVIVVARRQHSGISSANHLATKQFFGGHLHYFVTEAGGEIVEGIEKGGRLALPLYTTAIDFDVTDQNDLTPAGQGALPVRMAAVVGGMGTMGLNNMLLTPQFGPRIVLGAVLTDLELPLGVPLTEELCPGLEKCGRCAAVCPAQAIPLSAPIGAGLDQVRNLDRAACARYAQPHGVNSLMEIVEAAFETKSKEELIQNYLGEPIAALWRETAMMKEAAYMGCMECEAVCPVGADFEMVIRHQDPQEEPQHTISDGRIFLNQEGL